MAKKGFFSWFRKDKSKEQPQEVAAELNESTVADTEQVDTAKVEAERVASEQAEAVRIATEQAAQAEAERLASEQAEAVRIANEQGAQAETERLESEQAEAARIASEQAAQAEAERVANEQAEAARIANEQAAQAEAERIAAEKLAAEQEAVSEQQPEPQAKPVKEGLFARLKRGLKRTSESIGSGFVGIFSGKKIDDDLFEELEEQLLIADVGVETTTRLIKNLTDQASRKQLKDGEALYDLMRDEMQKTLEPVSIPLVPENADGPFVILMVGVNGVGKTTTIGKLAKQYQAQGKSVMLAAGDTFRAAAVEQLQVWGQRNNVPVIAQHTGADSASVI